MSPASVAARKTSPPVAPAEKLREDLAAAVLDRAFIGEDEPPRTPKAFEEQKKRAKARLPAVTEQPRAIDEMNPDGVPRKVLFVAGAADMVSVNIRQTLVQLATPDAMRGRVSAVSMLFISASNELGEAYCGVMVRALGPVGAALTGGVGALMATGLWARTFPTLRQADRLG